MTTTGTTSIVHTTGTTGPSRAVRRSRRGTVARAAGLGVLGLAFTGALISPAHADDNGGVGVGVTVNQCGIQVAVGSLNVGTCPTTPTTPPAAPPVTTPPVTTPPVAAPVTLPIVPITLPALPAVVPNVIADLPIVGGGGGGAALPPVTLPALPVVGSAPASILGGSLPGGSILGQALPIPVATVNVDTPILQCTVPVGVVAATVDCGANVPVSSIVPTGILPPVADATVNAAVGTVTGLVNAAGGATGAATVGPNTDVTAGVCLGLGVLSPAVSGCPENIVVPTTIPGTPTTTVPGGPATTVPGSPVTTIAGDPTGTTTPANGTIASDAGANGGNGTNGGGNAASDLNNRPSSNRPSSSTSPSDGSSLPSTGLAIAGLLAAGAAFTLTGFGGRLLARIGLRRAAH